MMSSITRWVLAHRRVVTVFWILVTLVGIATVGKSTGAFSKKFSNPGREGFVTNSRILALYHSGGRNAPIVPVVTLPQGTPVDAAQVRTGLEKLESTLHQTLRGAGGARFRVRLAARVRADPDRDRLDHDHVPGSVGRQLDYRRFDDRRVPGGADRPRHRDRLLAPGGGPLARGTRARPHRRRGR